MRTVSRLLIVFLILVFCSCSTKLIKVEGDPAFAAQLKKAALIEFIVAPPDVPLFPLIDAGMYKGSMMKIGVRIVQVNKDKSEDFSILLGNKLKAVSGQDVLFGNDLYDSPSFLALPEKGVTLFNNNIKHSEFTEISIPKSGKNFFDFSKTSNALSVIEKTEAATKENI